MSDENVEKLNGQLRNIIKDELSSIIESVKAIQYDFSDVKLAMTEMKSDINGLKANYLDLKQSVAHISQSVDEMYRYYQEVRNEAINK